LPNEISWAARWSNAGGPCQSLTIALPKTEAVISRKDDRIDAEKFPEPEAALGLHSERRELLNAFSGRTERENSEFSLKLLAESSDFDSAIRRFDPSRPSQAVRPSCRYPEGCEKGPPTAGFCIWPPVTRLPFRLFGGSNRRKSPAVFENIPVFRRLRPETWFERHCPARAAVMPGIHLSISGAPDRMSALPPKADIGVTHRHVRFGPIANMGRISLVRRNRGGELGHMFAHDLDEFSQGVCVLLNHLCADCSLI